MGSGRKSKTKRKSKDETASSSPEDEGRRKRRRSGEEERSRKSEKRDKRKDRKSHRHSSREEKLKDRHKSRHHKREDHSKHGFQELSEEDYFLKNNEFSTWLKEEKNIFFSELSSESAREMFTDFVKAWNKEKLDSRYYQGIASAPRTAHNWKIKE